MNFTKKLDKLVHKIGSINEVEEVCLIEDGVKYFLVLHKIKDSARFYKLFSKDLADGTIKEYNYYIAEKIGENYSYIERTNEEVMNEDTVEEIIKKINTREELFGQKVQIENNTYTFDVEKETVLDIEHRNVKDNYVYHIYKNNIPTYKFVYRKAVYRYADELGMDDRINDWEYIGEWDEEMPLLMKYKTMEVKKVGEFFFTLDQYELAKKLL